MTPADDDSKLGHSPLTGSTHNPWMPGRTSGGSSAGAGALAGAGLARADTPRIGAEDDWYPYTAWRDEQIVGMSADIVRAAFASSETSIELAAYPYSRCMELARSGALAACQMVSRSGTM